MGENGAGKSTLMKCLIGMYIPDSGTVRLDGREVSFQNTRDGLANGISIIHQELSPVPEMTVAENIWLGREPRNRFGLVDHRLMVRKTRELFETWNIAVDPRRQMKKLTVARQQMVEIAKAISYDAKIVIMDEPTSAIPEREVEHLHAMIRQLTAQGVAVIYITHKMDEVFKISDDITVFRDGKHVATKPASELDRHKLIEMMVGRELTDLFPKLEAEIGEVVMEVKGLNRGDLVKDVSFQVRRGEILGFAGLMGAGRTEVLETIFGIEPAESGEILVEGKRIRIRQPKDAIKANIGLLTEDRKLNGIMGVLPVRDNIVVAALPAFSPNGFLNLKKISQACDEQKSALKIKTPSMDQKIQNLSGGNQQKALISRWLLTLPDVLMIDEPTRGIDVGAKSEIHRLMSLLAQQGKAIIMVSSELPEVLGMSDRIIVMHEGRVSGELSRAEANQEAIMNLATGGTAAAAASERSPMSTSATTTAKTKFDFGNFLRTYAILFILIGFVILLAIITGGRFLAPQNLINVIVQIAPIGIIALGMMFAIITKGIDLSVGATVAVAAVVGASLAQLSTAPNRFFEGLPPLPIFVPVLAGLLVGAVIGAIIGFLVATFKIAPFIATLGMMTAARGVALIYTDGRPISQLAPGFNWLGQGQIIGIPVPVWLLALCALVVWVILNRTRFGRHVYAIGGNEQAARVSGVNIARVQFFIYTLIGTLAGLAGLILAGRIGSGNPQLGLSIELDAITAAVIGGTSFSGGVGTVWGAVVGAVIIGVINNGLDLMNVSPFMQMVVKGIIIVIAIIIDERKNR